MFLKSIFVLTALLSVQSFAQELSAEIVPEINPLTKAIRDNDNNQVMNFIGNVNTILLKPTLDHTPLHEAASLGRKDLILSMIKEVKRSGRNFKNFLNANDETGSTPLMMAISNGHYDIANLLINEGADIISSDYQGMTTLHILASGVKLEEGKKPFQSEAAQMYLSFVRGGANPRGLDGTNSMTTDYFSDEIKNHPGYKDFLSQVEKERSLWLSANSKKADEPQVPSHLKSVNSHVE